MSQDGSWVEPEVPAEIHRLRLFMARVERLEQELRNQQTVVAALVVKHGEPCGPDGRSHRLAVTESELTEVAAGTLRTNMDPGSGALLIRFHPA